MRLTKDNILVVHHDQTLDRTTNIKGKVRDFTFEQLQVVDSAFQFTPYFKKAPYSSDDFPYRNQGFHISSFTAFMDYFEDNYKNIEIKDDEIIAADLVWKELQTRNCFDKTIVTSSHCNVLNHFRIISNYQVATGSCETEVVSFIASIKLGFASFWFWANPPKANVLQVPLSSSGIHFDKRRIIQSAHYLNQKMMFWVINDAETAQNLLKLGADGIVTDRPDIIYKVFYENGYVNQSLESKLSNITIGIKETFFIPDSNSYDLHTCRSLSCKILPFLFQHLILITALLVLLLLLLLVRINIATNLSNDAKKFSSKKKFKID